MVYGREIDGRELNFEASGALLDASLVMRDRETDSWWSIMSSDAIGGPLDGADLEELPFGTKIRWGEWRQLHPDTLVLSVDGREHVESNPYDNYFASDGTFRGLEIDDDRLAPKEPIYSFRLGGRPFAVPHRAVEGGATFAVGDRQLLFFRRPGAEPLASTEAWAIPAGVEGPVEEMVQAQRCAGGRQPPRGVRHLPVHVGRSQPRDRASRLTTVTPPRSPSRHPRRRAHSKRLCRSVSASIRSRRTDTPRPGMERGTVTRPSALIVHSGSTMSSAQ